MVREVVRKMTISAHFAPLPRASFRAKENLGNSINTFDAIFTQYLWVINRCNINFFDMLPNLLTQKVSTFPL